MSFSFSAIGVEKYDDMGRLRFSSGKLHFLMGEPESSVRSYLYSIRDHLGHEGAHCFPLDYYKNDKFSTLLFSEGIQ